ncbi:TetR/AcrR family transcriptional regulator [Acidovorax sp. SUPP2522]|uniref:TetR/AcrR family transcriptional regulator n=1 Tax=unclassified Acidovorax TaxID=2684926 RepID=UPI002349054A|nr:MULTISPECIES: TetR/AcrR family transcriptional regulator [unclassified Acidovorax]WCM98921.1 TetR/AcrR family transcriptional regulator [Acidovorax sp. GBBC 1281]GKT19701.1 TetR/AcrR family transcriptional regulator [Acidovorax sp. SUPP2522]
MPPTEGRAPSVGRSPLGRPSVQRAQELRQIIVDVASALMLEHGYAGTSMEAIATAAGVTKRTIYTRFESKENLLREVLATAALPALQLDLQFAPGLALQDKLVRIGLEMNATLLHPGMQNWLRFAIHGIALHPELAPLVHGLIEQYLALLAQHLAALFASEAMVVDDLPTLAKVFASLISSPAQNLAAFAMHPGSPEEQAHLMHRSVAVFLAGCRAT